MKKETKAAYERIVKVIDREVDPDETRMSRTEYAELLEALQLEVEGRLEAVEEELGEEDENEDEDEDDEDEEEDEVEKVGS